VTRYAYQVVYPEGDIQEIPHRLRINQLVDLNGYPIPPPEPEARMIVYRVFRISTQATRGEETVSYHLELVRRDEMGAW
jgi:hypothetical protein